MKFYLSSFRVGDFGEKLAELANGGRLAYIPNAMDHCTAESQTEWQGRNLEDLQELGINVQILDLKDYFGRPSDLTETLLNSFSGVWVAGGNTFVLRQAMALSGFDTFVTSSPPADFLYAGFSAGVCILAPDMKPLQIVDDPNIFPYPEQTQTIWDGLGIINDMILPHFDSDHSESSGIDKEVAFCKEHGIPFRTMRDGEVLFGDDIRELRTRERGDMLP